ncbi:MAG: acyl-CoA dehydrogenase [Pseudonocardia sp. SCN 72-86]|nr:MAG: acyl-CoA dehydrogenase [Pseudonocardia sp. SCN 72-86]
MTVLQEPPVGGLTDEQRALVETAESFAAKRFAPHAVEWDRDKHFPVDVLREAAELGMAGLYVAEDHGGTGLSRLEAVLVFESLATGCPSLAAYLSIHNMVAGMIDRHGSEEQRARLLPGLCSMAELGSYCLTEPDAGSDAAALRTTAVRDGSGWVLDGVKQFISGAGASDRYLVFARTGETGPRGISAFVVSKDAEGLSFGPNEAKMGWNAQPTRQVVLRGVRVGADDLVGAEGEGFRIAMGGLDGGRLNIGACSLGGARAALDKAATHLGERQAFGRPLSAQQALRFRIADAHTELEAARLLLHRAAQAHDAGEPDATRLCAMAKRLATDTGFAVANEALQLHGGYGYLAEYGIEKIVRDLRVHQILEGTNEIMRVIVSRALLGSER